MRYLSIFSVQHCRVFLFLPLCISLCGCIAKLNSIYRKTDLGDDGTAIVTDAKQRVVVARPVVDDGNTRVYASEIVCVEPSPDVASSYSAALSAAVKDTEATASLAESVAQLGER